MHVEEFDDAASFLASVEPLLVEREAENCLLLGLVNSRVAVPRQEEQVFLAAVFDDDGDVVAASIRTVPYDLILSYGMPPETIEPVVRHVSERYPELPGVLGAKGPTDDFAAAWAASRGVNAELFRAEGIHKATEVIPPVGIEGEARPLTKGDRGVVMKWLAGFSADIYEPLEPEVIEEITDEYLSGSSYEAFLWWRGDQPVSMGVVGSPTPNGARISAVYTPPEYRGHGYATGLTAALTRHAFDQGRRLCFLFTDLANPTSNRIYQRVGYRPVCDVSHYRFYS